MTEKQLETRNRDSRVACLACTGALILTVYAFLINNVTLATSDVSDYTSIVVQAVVCAGIAILLVVLAWRRIPLACRSIAALFVLANLWTLLDAGGRRLPVILGW